MTGFEHALRELRLGITWRRAVWKKGKVIVLHPGTAAGMMSFIALLLPGGGFAPWTPTRCDLLEQDWERGDGT